MNKRESILSNKNNFHLIIQLIIYFWYNPTPYNMKHFIIILVLIITSSVAYSQWTTLISGSTAELRGVYFTNPQVGYVAGSDGTLLKTTDGGTNWTVLTSSTTDTLRSVYFTDDTTGYACGANGTIIKTIDAGNTWNPQTSNVPNLLRSVFFPSHDIGYVAGGGGTILKTIDGGANWTQQISDITQDLISIRFINNDTGWAASSLGTFLSGIILRTMDGGANWDTVYTNANGFLSVFCATADTIYCAGGFGVMAKSTDAGNTWNTLVSGSVNNLRGAFYTSGSRGYVVGDLGDVLYTNNGGTSYNNQTIQANGVLGVYFSNPDTGYACGTLGTILKFTPPCIPDIPVSISGPQTVCENDTATFSTDSVPNATSYDWTVPAGAIISSGQGDTLIIVIFGNTAGTVSVSAVNICGSSLPFMLPVTVSQAPIPGIILLGNTLFSNAATTYQWYLNGNSIPGATSNSYTITQNGSYQVLISNSAGCMALSNPITVSNVGIEEHNNEDAITISQVAQELVFISKQILLNPVVKIFDLSGKEIVNSSYASSRETKISINGISKGVYFYLIKSENENPLSGKVMVH